MNGPDTYNVDPAILPALMRLRDGDAGLERRAEIARARDAGEQQLLRRRRHDHRFELRRIRLVPVGVVAVPDDHRVDVHVPEPGQDSHAFGRDHLGAGGDRERADLTDRGDPLAVDEDDAVANRPSAEAVDERAADERLQPARLWLGFCRDADLNHKQGQQAGEQSGVHAKTIVLTEGLTETRSWCSWHGVTHEVEHANDETEVSRPASGRNAWKCSRRADQRREVHSTIRRGLRTKVRDGAHDGSIHAGDSQRHRRCVGREQ